MDPYIKDMIAIWAPILGPMSMCTLMGFMWYHFNNRSEKTDLKIDGLRGELKGDINGLRVEMNGLRVELKEDINGLRIELKEEINGLKIELNRIDEKLSAKSDAVRDRVSRIEGHLVPSRLISFESFEESMPTGITEQKRAMKQF